MILIDLLDICKQRHRGLRLIHDRTTGGGDSNKHSTKDFLLAAETNFMTGILIYKHVHTYIFINNHDVDKHIMLLSNPSQ